MQDKRKETDKSVEEVVRKERKKEAAQAAKEGFTPERKKELEAENDRLKSLTGGID